MPAGDAQRAWFPEMLSELKRFWENDAAELDRYIDVNARSLLQLCHAFSHRLREREATGGLILLSSLAGLWGTNLVVIRSASATSRRCS